MVDVSDSQPSFIGGNGTEENPYRISNVTELQWMGNTSNLDKHFVLVNDINASATKIWNSGEGFFPIGKNPYWPTYGASFTGSLDGKGYNITGWFINRSGTDYQGLFGYVGEGGVVNNVSLIDNYVSGRDYVGGLVGRNEGNVSNCYATGTVNGTGNHVGGLVGQNNVGTVTNCYSTGTTSGNYGVGGLVGYNDWGTVRNCYAVGTTSGSSGVGGLVGSNRGTVANCYSTGNVSGSWYVGGLVGNNYGTVTNSHYNINASLINNGYYLTLGGLFKDQYQDWYSSGLSLNISNYRSTLVPDGKYYNISSIQGLKDLLGFADNNNYRFRLASDIDLSSAPGLYIPHIASKEFDGGGHTISNLQLNQSFGSNLGMFGEILKGSTVSNLKLMNININGLYNVGGLAGRNEGTVTDCNSTGTTSGSEKVGGLVGSNSGETLTNCSVTGNTSGNDIVGGLVGYNFYGTLTNCSATGNTSGKGFNTGGLVGDNYNGTLTNCYTTGTTSGNYGVGGLVGVNWEGTLTNCSATGTTSGSSDVGGLVGFNGGALTNCSAAGNTSGTGNYVGGLVGYNEIGPVTNCSATGNTSGKDSVGGLVGDNWGGTVTNCYATGNTSGKDSVGGLVGSSWRGTVTKCFATGTVSGTGNDVGGLVGWNNNGIVTNCYSTVTTSGKGFNTGGLVGFNGGALTNCFAAGNISGSSDVGGLVGGNSGTVMNCSAAGTTSGTGAIGGLLGYNYYGTVMNCSAAGTTSGTYDIGGLVGDNSQGTVTNCYSTVTTSGKGFNIGGLVGFNGGALTNCFAAGNISGSSDVGGLVGSNGGALTNCFAAGNISGSSDVGGLVGSSWHGTVTNCYATGTTSGTGSYVGGLVGYSWHGTVTNCCAMGNVSGTGNRVGGLVGSSWRGTVTNCFAMGNVSGTGEYVGGLVGDNWGGTVTKCFTTGNVSGTGNYVGGLVGYNYNGTVTKCFTTGNVSGTGNYVGGLVGRNEGTVSNCYATGTVNGTGNHVGGLVGHNEKGTVSNCYATGTVSGTGNDVGGLVGRNEGTVADSYAHVAVTRSSLNNTDFGGFVGMNYRGKVLRCYSTGRVTYSGATDPTDKGFAGSVDTSGNYEMTGNFWDMETSGQTSTAGNATGKNTTEMMKIDIYKNDGWDMIHVRDHVSEAWYLDEGYDYPRLGWEEYIDIHMPVAVAGSDKTVNMSETVLLNGSVSSDNIRIVSYTWTFTDVAPISLSGMLRSYRFDNAGVFVVTLNVTDAAGNWDTDTMTVKVLDTQAPVANAGPDQFINMGETANFNGSLSTDNVGIVSITWTFTDVVPITLLGSIQSYRFDNAGEFLVTLNITDAAGNWATDTMTVTVLDTQSPVANAGPDQMIDEDVIIAFDGSGSTDNVGIVKFTWTFMDRKLIALYGPTPEYLFNNPGMFIVILNVSDAAGNWATATMTVTVRDITSPVANAGSDQRIAIGSTVLFKGSLSTDNVGIVRYTWTFDYDGVERTLEGSPVQFKFEKAGTYEIKLMVFDEYENIGEDTVIITVIDTGIVKGIVLDEKGDPVKGAAVEITSSDGSMHSTMTGENGSFSLMIPHGIFEWRISKSGYVPISGTSRVDPMGEVELDLSASPLVKEKGSSPSMIPYLLLAAILILLIAGILLIAWRRGSDKGSSTEE